MIFIEKGIEEIQASPGFSSTAYPDRDNERHLLGMHLALR